MKLENKTILLISPELWDHIRVSKHHYAIWLAKKGNKVFYLNPPSNSGRISTTEFKDLYTLDYKGFWKGLRWMPKFLRFINQRLVLKQLEQCANTEFDIIWSFDNSVFFDFDALPKHLYKISHIVDLNQDFNSARASQSANLCLGVIPEIVERHKRFNCNSHYIRHAFNQRKEKTRSSVGLPGSTDFKVVYFGNLGMPDLNWNLMERAINMIETDFIFFGSGHAKVPESIESASNTYILDPAPSDQLQGIMEASNLLMLFYSPSYFTNYASPHKVLEYLSSGKPILAPVMSDYLNQQHLIAMEDSEERWLERLKDIRDKYHLYNCTTLNKQRTAFALSNTYDHRVCEIEEIISMELNDNSRTA